MKHCRTCNKDVSDSYNFCKFCGSPLSQNSVPASGLRCPSCGSDVKAGWRFCKHCAHDLQATLITENPLEHPVRVAHSAIPDFPQTAVRPVGQDDHSASLDSPTARGSSRITKTLLLGLIAGAAVVLLFVTASAVYYFRFSNYALEKKLDDAIVRGNIFVPNGESAYDFYHQLKGKGADSKTLARYETKLLPQLTAGPLKLISDFAVPTNPEPTLSDWQNALRQLQWTVEIRPNDAALNARYNYIEGRIAFMSNQKDRALDLWKTASDVDRSWAMPANGIGVIYNERKSFETARRFLFEAIRRDAGWAVPYNSVGTAYYYENRLDEASTYYLRAVERSPNWARPHAWLGDIAMRRNDFSNAVREYETAINLAQSGSTTLDVNNLHKRLDRAKNKSEEMEENEVIDQP